MIITKELHDLIALVEREVNILSDEIDRAEDRGFVAGNKKMFRRKCQALLDKLLKAETQWLKERIK
jgi:hypothetical protein